MCIDKIIQILHHIGDDEDEYECDQSEKKGNEKLPDNIAVEYFHD
jgi:hypothetical protein